MELRKRKKKPLNRVLVKCLLKNRGRSSTNIRPLEYGMYKETVENQRHTHTVYKWQSAMRLLSNKYYTTITWLTD